MKKNGAKNVYMLCETAIIIYKVFSMNRNLTIFLKVDNEVKFLRWRGREFQRNETLYFKPKRDIVSFLLQGRWTLLLFLRLYDGLVGWGGLNIAVIMCGKVK